MKKQLALATAALMALSLAACGSTATASSAAESTSTAASSEAASTDSTAADDGDVLQQAAAAAFANDVTLTMWGAEEDQELLRTIADNFIKEYGNYGGKITINLTEYAEEASSKKATAGSSNGGSSSPAGVSTGVGPRLSAITVGASSSDKAAKKPNNTQLT